MQSRGCKCGAYQLYRASSLLNRVHFYKTFQNSLFNSLLNRIHFYKTFLATMKWQLMVKLPLVSLLKPFSFFLFPKLLTNDHKRWNAVLCIATDGRASGGFVHAPMLRSRSPDSLLHGLFTFILLLGSRAFESFLISCHKCGGWSFNKIELWLTLCCCILHGNLQWDKYVL